jgi:recombinational DNA repair protein RecR
LGIIHLLGKLLQQAANVRAEFELVRRLAQRIAFARMLAEIIVRGAQPVDGVAQEAPVKEEIAARLRNGIVNLMAGNRFDVGMQLKVIDDVVLLDAPVTMRSVEAR